MNIDDTPPRNIPTEPGTYWARMSPYDLEYYLLVEIRGKAPYLRPYRIHNLSKGTTIHRPSDGFLEVHHLFFGPKMEPMLVDLPDLRSREEEDEQ